MQTSPAALMPLLPTVGLHPSWPVRAQGLPGNTSKIIMPIRINTHIQVVAWEAGEARVVAVVGVVGGIAATRIIIGSPEGTKVPSRTIPQMPTRRQPQRMKNRSPTATTVTAMEKAAAGAGMRRLTATIRPSLIGCPVHSARRSR